MREIPLELTRGPFTVARAAEWGLSRRVLDGARFRAPFPGVRVLAGAPDGVRERCAAARLIMPEHAAFSHDTAVRLGEWPTPLNAPPNGDLHISLAAGLDRPRVRGIRAHRVTWAPGDVVVVRGLRTTSPERTWCDLAATGWSGLDLVVLADAIRRRRDEGGTRLARRLDGWGSQRGARRLAQALALSADKVDSPMETRLRLLFLAAGLPTPQVNEWVIDEFGDRIHRPDLSWPRWRVAADYDGAHHLQWDDEAEVVAGRRSNWRRRHDLTRQDQVATAGWQLRVFTAYDVLGTPQKAVTRMRDTLRRAGAPI